MSKLRGVLAAAFLVVIIPCAYAQDNGALLEVVAKELPAAAVFNGHGEAITLDLAVRCLQETDRTDEVADALAVGMDLGTVATQLSRRVWNGTYHEYTFADFFRVAFSVLRGPNAGSEYGSVYTFPFHEVLNRSREEQRDELTTRINLGSVSFVAEQYDGSYRVLGSADAEWRDVRDQIQRRHPAAQSEYQFVARDNTLIGVESDERLVSWNAKYTVLPDRAFLEVTLLNVIADVTRRAECASGQR